MEQFNQTQAYLEMDERSSTERILNEMTDPKRIEQRRLHKAEVQRVEEVINKHSLWQK
jgi:hypothetical protein